LGFDNLDALVMIYRNSFDDAQIDCKLAKEGITKKIVQKTNYLMNMRKNFRNILLRMSKKTL
jgi:hypothetical protein